MERQTIQNNVSLTFLPSDKFKRNRISISFIVPNEKEKATMYAVMPTLMERGYQDYPDMCMFSKKLNAMYGSNFSATTSVVGQNRDRESAEAQELINLVFDKLNVDCSGYADTEEGSQEHADMDACFKQKEMLINTLAGMHDHAWVMEQLDKRIGKINYQLLLLGRPIMGYDHSRVEQAGMPIQHFNVDRAAALTSTYLMAIYGHERWVDGGYGPFIYLNRTLIEQKRLSLETIQRQVANLLMDFEGVHVAYPIHEAITSDSRQSIYRKHAGDVYFQLQENWVLDASENQTYDHVLQAQPAAPLLFWSGTLRAFPNDQIQATDIKKLLLNY